MLTNAKSGAAYDRKRQRFLEAYRRTPVVALAAALAGVHRATIYRWRADPGFAAAMDAAEEAKYQENRAEAIAAEAERQRWRDERERARRPMRCHYLALAREARRRQRG